jgi:AAA15 family ATPase/GTPase
VKSIPCLKNNLYLSKAANTEGSPEILKNIYRYFKNKLAFIHPDISIEANALLKDVKQRKALTALLACADTGITGIELKERDIDTDTLHLPDNLSESMKGHIIESNKYQPVFFHNGKNEYEFELREESHGTRRLFELAPLFLIGLRRGDIIIIDEMDSSLHPHISELIIKLFHDPEVNKSNAQLIFTSHDITLMNQEFVRRDQVVLTEKNSDGITEIFSLDEIDGVRKDSPYSKWYLDGRMGAIPHIDTLNFKQLFMAEE